MSALHNYETDGFRWTIGENARTRQFVDPRTGVNYLAGAEPAPLAYIKVYGKTCPAKTARPTGRGLRLEFDGTPLVVELAVTAAERHLIVEVISVAGGEADELTFLDIPLAPGGGAPFHGCALALNLQTRVLELPGPQKRLRAVCYPRFGFVGARVAVIGCPSGDLRAVMQEVVTESPDIPKSDMGGPWALDAPANRGSYLFDFGSCTESTVADMIARLKSLGFAQLDFHGGHSSQAGAFRFGDFVPNPVSYPRGRASLKAVIDQLHAAGMLAGLHTYACFIAKDSSYVTPVPDPRLGADASFTLADDLDADAVTVPVLETTAGMSVETSFFIRNSVTLRINEELITYKGVSKTPPFAFTECTRGALGTRAAKHPAGSRADHLKECFHLFAPDGDSDLLEEIAANTADVFNECGFDMIYLDALDGEDVLGGTENGWHYGSKFVFEICKRLHRPVLMEMSTFHHHLWYVRSRMGAWDHPIRAYRPFVDRHCVANETNSRMFMPGQLGWWAITTPRSGWAHQFPEDLEYLLCKCLAHDVGFALEGVNWDAVDANPRLQQDVEIIRRYETLRHSGEVPDDVREKLRVPGAQYRLTAGDAGPWRFHPLSRVTQTVDDLRAGGSWRVKNPFTEQPARVRIEALFSAREYGAEGNITLADFSAPGEFTPYESAAGVTASLDVTTATVKTGAVSGRLTALNSASVPDGVPDGGPENHHEHWLFEATSLVKRGRWAGFSKKVSLNPEYGIGVWVHGDGLGEIINFQLAGVTATAAESLKDFYVPVDFEGWRYFQLLEREEERIMDYAWPASHNLYSLCREDAVRETELRIWLTHLPEGRPVVCHLSPVQALRRLRAGFRSVKLTIGETDIVLPVELKSGDYLELGAAGECTVQGHDGRQVGNFVVAGHDASVLKSGWNNFRIHAAPMDGALPPSRVRVTVLMEADV